jgi:hypothetical protein
MNFFAATGTIDPRQIYLNGDHAFFVLQDASNKHWVKIMGLEQYQILQNYQSGQNIFILGTAQQNKKKTTIITPRLFLNLDQQINGQAETIMQITLQIMEAHLWAKQAK